MASEQGGKPLYLSRGEIIDECRHRLTGYIWQALDRLELFQESTLHFILFSLPNSLKSHKVATEKAVLNML